MTSFSIIVSVGCLALLIATVTGAQHPCLRTCDGKPMVCEYEFDVEWYYTLTRACGNCLTNSDDCFLPHCITADGVGRVVNVVNRQLPGPDISVCRNDTIQVKVRNLMTGADVTTIHWHGIRQVGTPFMDGVSPVTQCPIGPLSSFLYKFQVPDSGTYFWHAHSGVQRGDGVYGPLIIRDPADPHMKLYDYDLPDHVVIVQDWFHVPSVSYKPNHLRDEPDESTPSVIINGRGRFHSPELNTTTPLATFTVTRGFRYRFRVISNGVKDCPIQLSIDNHNLTLIATDGMPFQPVTVEAFVILPGERYDFVLEAKQAVDNYWFRARGYLECFDAGAYQLATLRYAGAPVREPLVPITYDPKVDIFGAFARFNPPLTAMKGLTKPSDDISGVPDVKKYMVMDFNVLDYSGMDSAKRPSNVPQDQWTAKLTQINHITMEPPPVPVFYQYKDIPKDLFCDEDTVRDRNCTTKVCTCFYVVNVKIGQLVELVMADEQRFALHPLHLHGYSFYLVAMKELADNTTGADIRKLDEAGQIERNFVDPILKDTVRVATYGYTIVRFRANNPGFWFMHCHLDMHAEMGMGLFFKVGEPEDWPAEPENWQHCGGDFVAKMAAGASPSASSKPAAADDRHIGAIIGGVLGGVAVLALIAGIVAMVVIKQAASARVMAQPIPHPSYAVGQARTSINL